MHAIEVRRHCARHTRAESKRSRAIDFDVATGEVFGLLGPNGAGKSTTVGMLTTTIAPDGGQRACWPATTWPSSRCSRAVVSSVVFQEPVVDRGLSGRDNLELHARLWGIARNEGARRMDELVDALGLAELIDRPVGTYSGGERRRLEIARALVSQPAGSVPRRADRRARPADPPRAARRDRRTARTRRADDPGHYALPRRGRAAVRPRGDHPRRRARRARHARGRCSPGSATRSSSSASTATRNARWRACASAASPTTTRSRSAPASPCRSTSRSATDALAGVDAEQCAPPSSRPARRRSTTSTSG